jgi:hypothetical protein
LLVGLDAEIGETGVRGRALGDLSDSDGRGTFCAAEMLKDSFGLTTRAVVVYIVTDEESTIIEEVHDNQLMLFGNFKEILIDKDIRVGKERNKLLT